MTARLTRIRLPFWLSHRALAVSVALGLAGLILLYDHREHTLDGFWLLGLLLATCLFMHGFVHGLRGRRVGRGEGRADRRAGPPQDDGERR